MDSLFNSASQEPDLEILVLGALVSRLGRVSDEDRFRETYSGLAAVKSFFPAARITYADTSSGGGEHLDQLLAKIKPMTSQVLNLSEAEGVSAAYQTLSGLSSEVRSAAGYQGLVKSVLEAVAVSLALELGSIGPHPTLLKISARYAPKSLPWHSLTKYSGLKSGLSILAPKRTYIRPHSTEFGRYCRTVAWASKNVSREEIAELFDSARSTLLIEASAGRLLDLEHVFFRHIEGLGFSAFSKIGVSGRVGSSGFRITL